MRNVILFVFFFYPFFVFSLSFPLILHLLHWTGLQSHSISIQSHNIYSCKLCTRFLKKNHDDNAVAGIYYQFGLNWFDGMCYESLSIRTKAFDWTACCYVNGVIVLQRGTLYTATPGDLPAGQCLSLSLCSMFSLLFLDSSLSLLSIPPSFISWVWIMN